MFRNVCMMYKDNNSGMQYKQCVFDSFVCVCVCACVARRKLKNGCMLFATWTLFSSHILNTKAYMLIFIYTCAHTHTCMHARMHAHTHAPAHTHTHTHTTTTTTINGEQ